VEPIWYASYGSNMAADRFRCYISGGALQGMSRTYPGARDPRPAADSRGLYLPGQVYFAHESTVWGGGMAFLDPDAPGQAAARGYLITGEQFLDVIAQEMRRPPGREAARLVELRANQRLQLGPGRYETLVAAGCLDGIPVVSFTSPMPQRPLNTPSMEYVRTIARGLAEAHQWETSRIVTYLAGLPGVRIDTATLTQWLA